MKASNTQDRLRHEAWHVQGMTQFLETTEIGSGPCPNSTAFARSLDMSCENHTSNLYNDKNNTRTCIMYTVCIYTYTYISIHNNLYLSTMTMYVTCKSFVILRYII